MRVTGDDILVFPDYDGNGQFRSLGNIEVNARVGLLFMDFQAQRRKRVKGVASVGFAGPPLAEYPGALAVVQVRATEIFGNCPRYIHKMELVAHSAYVPCAGRTTPVPGWMERFRGVLPQRDPAVYGQLTDGEGASCRGVAAGPLQNGHIAAPALDQAWPRRAAGALLLASARTTYASPAG